MSSKAAPLLILLAAAMLLACSTGQQPPQLQVSASLDREQYTYGSILHVNGSMTRGGEKASSATILLQLISPSGSLILTWAVMSAESGEFELSARLPSEWPPGRRVLSITAQLEDQASTPLNLTFNLGEKAGRLYTQILSNPSVVMTLPDIKGKQARGLLPVVNASPSDQAAAGYIGGLCQAETIAYDTDSWYIDPETGEPTSKLQPRAGLVLLGGRIVNRAVYYYEAVSKQTPVYPEANSTHIWFTHQATGKSVENTAISWSDLKEEKADLFIIELFQDSQGRYVMICYGLGWRGTFTAALYLDRVIWPNIGSYNSTWHITKWIDDRDTSVEDPLADTYQLIAEG